MAAKATSPDKAEQLRLLKPRLTGDSGIGQLPAVAARVGLADVALRMAIHRLRKRFRSLVREETASTINDPAEIGSEMAYLIEALAQGSA